MQAQCLLKYNYYATTGGVMTNINKDYEELFKLKPITKDERMKQLRVLKPETKEKLRAMKRRLKDGIYHDKKQ